METLDHSLLGEVKKGFVKMPAGGGQGPVAGGGLMTQAQAAPMGGDPMAGGGAPPMDPAMGGGAPMDPAMMDPAMMGGGGGAPPMDPGMGMPPEAMGALPPEAMAALSGAGGGGASITMTVDDLINLIEGVAAAVKGKPRPSADPAAGGDPAAMGGDPAAMGGDPAAMGGGDPAAMGAPPPGMGAPPPM